MKSEKLETLQTVIVAGEAVSAGVVEKHCGSVGTVRLVNEYGPTEATVWSTAMDLNALAKKETVLCVVSVEHHQISILDGARHGIE